jgi:prepilin peptidase CpaA
VTIAGCVAAVIDLRTRRVPNELTAAVALIGVTFASAGIDRIGLWRALGGLALGVMFMAPGYLFGGTGAGDVKLFGAMGTLMGPAGITTGFIYTALAGGAIAVAVAIRRRRLRQTVGNASRFVMGAGANVAEIESPTTPNRFAYAPAIAIGTTLAALGL